MENKLQQAKDTIAKKYGYKNFEDLLSREMINDEHLDEISIEYHRLMSEWKKQSIEIIQSNERVFNRANKIQAINSICCLSGYNNY